MTDREERRVLEARLERLRDEREALRDRAAAISERIEALTRLREAVERWRRRGVIALILLGLAIALVPVLAPTIVASLDGDRVEGRP